MSYNRTDAVNYAKFYWDKVCHDALVATKTGYPPRVNNVSLTPGLPFSQIGVINLEEDCTHFLSCCVGNGVLPGARRSLPSNPGQPMAGGGLAISCPFQKIGIPIYGQTWTPALVQELRSLGAKPVGKDFEVKDYVGAAIKSLDPGDVLAYASKDNAQKYEHICLIVASGGKIACHTTARFGKDYDDVYYPWVTLLKMP